MLPLSWLSMVGLLACDEATPTTNGGDERDTSAVDEDSASDAGVSGEDSAAPDTDDDRDTGDEEGDDTGEVIEDVAFRCPEGASSLTVDLSEASVMEIGGVPAAPNGGFLEGPVWVGDALVLSQLYFSGRPNDAQMLHYTDEDGFSVFLADAGTNGIALDAAGRLVTANHKQTGIVRFELESPSTPGAILVDRFDGAPFNSPNDLVIAEDGTVYFTDPDYQCGGCSNQPVQGVYRWSPDGSIARLANVTQNKPNGIALSPDGQTLYVGGQPQLTAHPIGAGGSVGAGRPFGNIYGTDGLGVDCAGNVYVTAGEGVVVLDSSGARLGSLSVSQATNVAFGGPDHQTLFITSFGDNRGKLHRVRLNIPGYPY
ncbi:MAG: SMP-30/gluconolactonase/LRE family protein [Myxococcota bacterium]